MPLCSSDGHEVITFQIPQRVLADYCAVVGKTVTSTVPPLLLARIWARFEQYEKYMAMPIKLISTEVSVRESIYPNTCYYGMLIIETPQKKKAFTIFNMALHVYEYNKTQSLVQCSPLVIIQQRFVLKGDM